MKTSWQQLIIIQVGGAICLPVVMVGQLLAHTMNQKAALIAIASGNFFLMLAAIFFSSFSVEKRKSTMEHAETIFGSTGPRIFGSLFLASLMGWFAIQLNMMSESIFSLFPKTPFPQTYVNLIIGALVTFVAVKGIRGLELFSKLSIPLLITTLGIALFLPGNNTMASPASLSIGGGVSLVVATAVFCLIDLPTYWRHARTKKDGVIAAILLFGVALPCIESVGFFLGVKHGATHILGSLQAGGGALWTLWVALFLLLAGWASNNGNLYSAGVNAFALLPRWTEKKRTLVIGGAGTLLSCMRLLDHFAQTLEFMGIAIASMGGVVLGSYLFGKTGGYTGFVLGMFGGICAFFGWISVTTSPVIDAYLWGLIPCLLGRKYETVKA